MAERTYHHEQTMDEMIAALRQFFLFAAQIDDEDVARALEVLRGAHTLGPIVDPTAYRRSLYNGSLERQEAIATLFQITKAKLLEIFPGDAGLLNRIHGRGPEAV